MAKNMTINVERMKANLGVLKGVVLSEVGDAGTGQAYREAVRLQCCL
jgi:hypothetical protein